MIACRRPIQSLDLLLLRKAGDGRTTGEMLALVETAGRDETHRDQQAVQALVNMAPTVSGGLPLLLDDLGCLCSTESPPYRLVA